MNTLRYALRFLLRARTYTLINLLGLAFSLACCIILDRKSTRLNSSHPSSSRMPSSA